jgi:Protein of unknown function (DUF2752)
MNAVGCGYNRRDRMPTTARMMRNCAVAATAVVLYAFDPATSPLFPSCPLRVWTGWLCPGCGTLRAMHALLHGSLDAALQANVLATFAILCVGIAWLRDQARPATSPWLLSMRRAAFSAAGVALVLLFGALRNIPVAPFSWLTP